MTDAVIQSITCPITQDIMKNAAVGSDGNTYDREAIERWLDQKETSPLTNEQMLKSSLKVNPAIQFLIDQYHKGQLGEIIPVQRVDPKKNNIKVEINTNVYKKGNDYLISISDKLSNIDQIGTDLVICIDRSGSTGSGVEAKDSDNNSIESGFTILDIILHAASTIASVLNENDRFSCIIYDDIVERFIPFIKMSEINKSTVLTKLKTITPRNRTNIYGATKEGLNMIEERDDKTRNPALINLTDGQPNVSPARGEVVTLKNDKKKINFSTPIYTMGFGYNLMKDLLYPMAKITNATTCHIPDGGMVATVFCNLIATIKCTIALNMQINIVEKSSNSRIYGDFNVEHNKIDIGTLQFQQSRNIIITSDKHFTFTVSYKAGGNLQTSEIISSKSAKETLNDEEINKIKYHKQRLNIVEYLRTIISYKSINEVDKAKEEYNKCLSESKTNSNINKTLKDQIEKAINNHSWWIKWGEFYVDQLSSHMLHEKRPNFKDTACFDFGGEKFDELVDFASDTFDTLPPPAPSKTSSYYGGSSYAASAPVIRSLATYNCQDNGCFAGDCDVLMEDNKTKKVKDIVAGDKILSMDNFNEQYYTIKYVLKTVIPNDEHLPIKLVNFPGGLKITEWHPIQYWGKWTFPIHIQNYEEKIGGETVTLQRTHECNEVYSFVLESGHVAIINGIKVICLGHGGNDPTIKHEYLGTEKVVKDLDKKENINGVITITPNNIIRDPSTTKIIGIV
jgi:hypothetical protein